MLLVICRPPCMQRRVQQWLQIAGLMLRMAIAMGTHQALSFRGSAEVLELDGHGSYVALPNGLGEDLVEFTIEFRVRWDHLGYFDGPLHFGDTECALGLNHQDRDAGTPVVFLQSCSPVPVKVTGGNVIRAGEWAHLAATFGPRGIGLYVNGERLGFQPAAFPAGLLSNAPARWLGRSPWPDNGYFRGALDDVCLWRRVLEAGEIRARRSSPVPAADPDLVAAWTFDTVEGAPGSQSSPGLGKRALAATFHGGARLGPGVPWREQEFPPPIRIRGHLQAIPSASEGAEVRLWRGEQLLQADSSSADGTLALDLVEGPGPFELEVTHGAWGARKRFDARPGDTVALEIQLLPARSISGRVTTLNGIPQAGVAVEAWLQNSDPHSAAPERPAGSVTSDSGGRFEFIHLRPGRYRFACASSQTEAILGRAAPSETLYTLEEGAELRLPDFRLPRILGPRVWKPVARSEGVPDRPVVAVVTDGNGRLWMATSMGLVRRDELETVVWRYWDGLPSDQVTSLAFDSGQRLWIGTSLGLVLLEEGRLVPPQGPGAPDSEVTAIHSTSDGSVWVGTKAGLARWYGGAWRWYGGEDGLPSPIVQRMHGLPGGKMLVKTAGGPVIGKDARFELIKGARSLPGFEDPELPWRPPCAGTPAQVPDAWHEGLGGEAWALVGSWLFHRHGSRWHSVNWGPGSATDSEILSLAVDEAGIVWLGTRSHGLIRGEVPSFANLTEEDGLPGRAVTCTERTPDGALWIGTRGGLACWRNGALQAWTSASGFPAQGVQSLRVDRNGRLWIGTERGVIFWDGSHFASPSGGTRRPVRSISEGPDGTLWYSTGGDGLYQSLPNAAGFRKFGLERGIWEGHLSSVLASRDGALWYTQDQSVTRVTVSGAVEYVLVPDRGATPMGALRFHVAATNSSGRLLPGNTTATSALAESPKGSIWVGTWRNGLLRFQEGQWTHFPPDSGLDSPDVTALCAGRDGRVWCGTSSGVRVFDGDFWSTLNGANGIADGEVKHIRADADGTLWFATADGLIRFTPSEARPPAPILSFETGATDNDSRSLALVPAGERVILSARRPAAHRVCWRIEAPGEPAVWSAPSASPTLRWRPKQPGTARVYAMTLDPSLNRSEIASLSLLVVRPWHRNPWVIAPAAALALLLTGMAAWNGWRGRQSRREADRLRRAGEERDAQDRSRAQFAREILNAQEAERRRLAHELHDSLGQELLLIRNAALLGARRIAEQSGPLSDIAERASRTINEVRSIAYALRPQELDRLGLVRALETLCQEMSESGGLEWSFAAEKPLPPLPLGAEISLYRVAQEALSNVVRHAAAGHLRFHIKTSGSDWHVDIQDDGCGFEVAAADRSASLGLLGMRERIRLCGGSMDLQSAPGAGTQLHIRIPAASVGPQKRSP